MVRLFYAKISAVNFTAGKCSVCIPDRENQVVKSVPFISVLNEIPPPMERIKTGDTVAVIFEVNDGRLEKGVVLGRI
jgi:hypothetical protein